jgi:hypothetical protein
MVIGIFIAIIIVVILWGIIWFRAHRVPASYIILFMIFMMPYVALIARMIMKYLPQVPPLRWFLIFVGANYLIYLFSVSSLAFTLVGVGMLPPLPSLKGSAPSVVNATLEEYVLLNCHGTNFFNPESLNKAASISLALSQSLINLLLEGILPAITILWLSTILPLRKLLNGNKEKAYNTLCRDDRLLLSSYIAMTLITYLSVGLSIIIYSLAILSSSEFPYAYAMLITTFLVLIVEILMIHNGVAGSPWPWVALFISVVSSLFYTVVAFYISGFILPSTCLTGINNDVLGIYEFSLPLVGISGAIPYALTLSIIHHRIMCPRVEAEEN